MNRKLSSLLIFGSVVSGSALANVTGNDAQNFNPATGSTNYVTVNSTNTLGAGRFNLGLYFSHAANTLPYAKDEAQSESKNNDSVTGMDLMVGVGLWKNLELGVAAPFVVRQVVDEDETRGEFAERGNTGLRVGLKWAFVQKKNWGLALVPSATVNRMEDDPNAGATSQPVYNGELAFDTHAGRNAFGVNVGYRKRSPGDEIEGSLVAPMSDEYIASMAYSSRFTTKAAVVTEVYGSQPVKELRNDTERSTSSAEALLGLRYAFQPTLVGQMGAGTELVHGFSTPDWRIYAGITTEFGAGKSSPGKTVAKKAKKKDAPLPKDNDFGEDNGPGMDQIPTEAPDEVFVLHNINFEFDSDYRVLPGALSELEKLNAHLQKTGFTKLVVEGHTDYYGSDDYNESLSLRRARTVRHQMIKYFSYEKDQVIAAGFGEQMPLTEDMSDAGRQLNRRVEIKIYRD